MRWRRRRHPMKSTTRKRPRQGRQRVERLARWCRLREAPADDARAVVEGAVAVSKKKKAHGQVCSL